MVKKLILITLLVSPVLLINAGNDDKRQEYVKIEIKKNRLKALGWFSASTLAGYAAYITAKGSLSSIAQEQVSTLVGQTIDPYLKSTVSEKLVGNINKILPFGVWGALALWCSSNGLSQLTDKQS